MADEDKPQDGSQDFSIKTLRIGQTSELVHSGMNLRYQLPPETEADREYLALRTKAEVLEGEAQRQRRENHKVSFELLDKLSNAMVLVRAAQAEREATQQLDEFDFLARHGSVLAPWLDPRRVIEVVINSDILTACVIAMAKNVGGHGWELVPRLSPEAIKQVDASTTAEIEKEKLRLQRFFRAINPSKSFVDIRRETTADKETVGWGCWELLRNGKGELAGIEQMHSWTTRLTPLDDYVECDVPEQQDDGTWGVTKMERRFRRVVQQINGRFRYFKQHGDPRTIDSLTGRPAATEDEAKMLRETKQAAHEVILFVHHGVSCGITPYGIPRWVGAVYAALGRRQAAEVNLLYFDNKAVPPLAVLVSGGQLTASSTKAIEERFRAMKGRNAFHDVLILEALPAEGATPFDEKGRMTTRLQIQPLTEAQNKDSLFAGYSKDCRDDVRMTFGIPGIMVGLSNDYNRATADTAAHVAEKQTFQPEREQEDYVINAMLLAEMGIRYWTFKTKSGHVVSEDQAAALLALGLEHGALLPDEARVILSRLLGHPLDAFGTDWANRPSAINAAMAAAGIDFTTGQKIMKALGAAEVDAAEDPDVDPAEVEDQPGDVAVEVVDPAKPKEGEAGSVEAGEADAAAGADQGKPSGQPKPKPTKPSTPSATGDINPTPAPRSRRGVVYRVLLPQEAIDTATVVDGLLKLRDDFEAELLHRYQEQKRSEAAV